MKVFITPVPFSGSPLNFRIKFYKCVRNLFFLVLNNICLFCMILHTCGLYLKGITLVTYFKVVDVHKCIISWNYPSLSQQHVGFNSLIHLINLILIIIRAFLHVGRTKLCDDRADKTSTTSLTRTSYLLSCPKIVHVMIIGFWRSGM